MPRRASRPTTSRWGESTRRTFTSVRFSSKIALQLRRVLGVLEDLRLEVLELVVEAVEDREVAGPSARRRPGTARSPAPRPSVLGRVVASTRSARRRRSPSLGRSWTVISQSGPRKKCISCSVELADRPAVAGEALEHHELVVGVLLELRPLVEVEAVLDGQPVQAEALRQRLQRLGCRDLDVDPPDAGASSSSSPPCSSAAVLRCQPRDGDHRPDESVVANFKGPDLRIQATAPDLA